MAHLRCVVYILTAILLMSVIAEPGASEPEGLTITQLPASKEQIDDLAQNVCIDIFLFEEKDKDVKIESCKEKIANSSSHFSSLPSKLIITDRSENEVTFSIPGSNDSQLAILVPFGRDGFVRYRIVNITKEPVTIAIDPSSNYSSWSTVLNGDGAPSGWLQGPDVPRWIPKHEAKMDERQRNKKDSATRDNNYVEIHKPTFQFNNVSEDVEATFRLDFDETLISGSNVWITNNCIKKDGGNFLQTHIKPSANLSLVVRGLSLDDNCTFIVHENDNHRLSHEYHTPPCEQLTGCISSTPLPEVPRNVSIEASENSSGAGWDVRVRWARPARAPRLYNVTLRADRLHTLFTPGNATEVTFGDVTGEGFYNVSVEAIYANHKAATSRRALFNGADHSVSGLAVGAWCVALVVAALLAAIGAVWWKRRRAYLLGHLYFQGLEDKFPKDWGSENGPESGVDDRWEIRSERLQLHEVIGEGAFGVVRRGTLAPADKEVAVKMLKDFPTLEEIRSFRVEMELMKSVGVHPHIVSLVGCCTGRRRPRVVAEYCSKGDLLTFLRCSWDVMVSRRNAKYYNNNLADYRNDLFKSKPQREHSKLVVNKMYDLQGICDAELTSLDLLSFCRQIAMGMEFLALNKVVHRDLAARNVLVSADRTLKIADFGLSRDVYQENQYKQKGNGKMPVKWMALESLTHRIYTTQSDVWSFGVVVWEVVTMGAAPYPEVPASRLPRLLRAGYRMPRPNNCSKQLYEVMLSCWRARPRDRPPFSELHATLDVLLGDASARHYLSLELDDDALAPHTPKSQRYVKMILRANRMWSRGETYERPLKAPQSNHYSSPPAQTAPPALPAPLARPQLV